MGQPDYSTLKSVTLADLLERDFHDRQVILEPWLRAEETCVIWSASGVGKTMFCLSIALAVAGAGTIADWEAPSARKVLYIDGEMHLGDVKDRLKGLIDAGRIITRRKQRDDAAKNLTILARQDQRISSTFYDLTDPDAQKAILKRVQDMGAELLILDNFTTLSDGLDDENDATSFKKVQDFFLKLKRAGIATILVHHANKRGKQMRGSTALETTFEVVLGLTRPKVASAGQACFDAEFGKFRGKGDASLERRKWTLEENGWSVSDSAPDDPKEDAVYHAVTSLDFVSQSEIAKMLGINKSTVSRRVDKLVALGVLKDGECSECFAKARDLRKKPEERTVYDTPYLEVIEGGIDEAF